MAKPRIDVIIPAFNEENSVGKVIADIPKELVREIIVANNASTDRTPEMVLKANATLVDQPLRGYGNACLKGIDYLKNKPKAEQPDIVVFLDADYSDHPEEMTQLVQPIIEDNMDMVIGSRALGEMESGSMTPQQIFGNWLATSLIRLFYKYEFTDLGPFRAITFEKLMELDMQDQTYGWTVEMQVKAAKMKFNCIEIPVTYRQRIGFSKISGTVKGTILAGHKILWTIFKLL